MALSPRNHPLRIGDPVDELVVRTTTIEQLALNKAAGRVVVILLFETAAEPRAKALCEAVLAHRDLFDDTIACLFTATRTAGDVEAGLARRSMPGVRAIIDEGGAVKAQLGAPDHACMVMLDPRMRVMATLGTSEPGSDPAALVEQMLALIAAEPALIRAPAAAQAPVLIVPRVFEPELCRRLIEGFETGGATDSGYMKTVDGQIQGVIDHRFKRRSDWLISDERLKRACMERIKTRLVPQVDLAFRFRVTRMERHIVACYDGETGGFFKSHRDNEGDGYRQFAVTLNLNAEDYEGGDLCFPEFGQLTYRAPTGGACVFACSLLHEATPVTAGRRYAYLPFLYDEASAERREELSALLADPTKRYRRQGPPAAVDG